MNTIYRHILTLLFLLLSTCYAKAANVLWNGIRDAGAVYEQGFHDSAFVMIRRLLVEAESQNDHLAMATLHHLRGVCLFSQGKENAARQELAECISIGEAHNFLDRAVRTRNSFIFETMLPSYARLAIDCKDIGRKKESLDYARNGMKWVGKCSDASLRVQSLSCFAEILMDNKEYSPLYEPLKRGVDDAIGIHRPDYALLMVAQLIEIECLGKHRKPNDIKWTALGKQLENQTKSQGAKNAFHDAMKLLESSNSSSAVLGGESRTEVSMKGNNSDATRPAIDKAKSERIVNKTITVRQRNERIGVIAGLLVMVLLAFVAYIVWQRRRRKTAAMLAEQEKNESYAEGQESERSRLAKELHDGVSNQLLAVQMKLDEDGLTPQTMQLLKDSREQVRRVSHQLIPPEFEHTNLDEAICNYASELDGVNGCEVSYTSSPENADWTIIPSSTALEIYRIVQETVTNALKHANATSIAIGMHLTEGNALALIISDNGKNDIETVDSKGIGKRTITERAAAINGQIELYRHELGNVVKMTILLN